MKEYTKPAGEPFTRLRRDTTGRNGIGCGGRSQRRSALPQAGLSSRMANALTPRHDDLNSRYLGPGSYPPAAREVYVIGAVG
jgi:hypothetical protein